MFISIDEKIWINLDYIKKIVLVDPDYMNLFDENDDRVVINDLVLINKILDYLKK